MVLKEPLHHRVRGPVPTGGSGSMTLATAATATSFSSSKTPSSLRRRVRGTTSTTNSMLSSANESILLWAALLTTVGLTALTVSLGVAVYGKYHPSSIGDSSSLLLQDHKSSPRGLHNTGGHGGHGNTAASTTAGAGNREQYDDDDEKEILPWNAKYIVPHSYETVGDRSDEYVLLRQEIDLLLPENPTRSLNFIHQLHRAKQLPVMFDIAESDTIPYDIYDCPNTPPPNYPFAWNLVGNVLKHWPVNEMKIPDDIHQGLCVFDYTKDHDKAMTYRTAELPFIVINDPQVAAAAERWNQPNYMERLLGDVLHRTEYSENSHFMYYIPISKKAAAKAKQRNALRNGHGPNIPKDWKEPTKLLRMSYAEWLSHANTTRPVQPDEEHWYYRLIGCGEEGPDCDTGSSEYLFDELPFFQPKPSLYMVEPSEQKGIHCRFGMSGVIAENHFDASRNAITVLSGSRRYILTHPNQCDKLALYPKGHPSARHSAVDWTNPDLTTYPQFANAMSNEVVLTAGQVLYLPTDWFHFIVSLELNFQCNTRSGTFVVVVVPTQC
jgi:hypothetical protein